ncbi:MAG: DUF2190 family protein [Rhodospirillales bacterium]|jgi:hypothetical protein
MPIQARSPGKQIKTTRFAHSAATTRKVPVLINSRVWIPLESKGANEENEYIYEAEMAGGVKATGEAWTPGGAIYWDNTNARFTTTLTGNTLCGRALEAAVAGATVTPRFQFNSLI